ncbi:uncharacterized protein [Nicotiana tomentosiformis]|uniref:uncharacterized protein n=1 Tax=Nicotiana tomentosiformis TaxID=4098 RepID=UPI00388CE2C3
METNYIKYVQKCHQCQIHADMIRVPPNELNAASLPWRLSAWGMDVIRPIEPAASNGHIFILVAIDYFMKWVKAASYKAVTKKIVEDFVRDHIIKHQNSTAYRPQMNGVVEATNKNIKKILRKMVDNYKQWNEKLQFDLLEYRTIVRTSTRATPYILVYGTEAVIPVRVEIPSFRVIQEAEVSDAEWVHSRYEQLALIDGKRMNTDEAKGKFSPSWQGPYIVHRVLTEGALILAEMDGEIWPKPINSDAVKRYYV